MKKAANKDKYKSHVHKLNEIIMQQNRTRHFTPCSVYADQALDAFSAQLCSPEEGGWTKSRNTCRKRLSDRTVIQSLIDVTMSFKDADT